MDLQLVHILVYNQHQRSNGASRSYKSTQWLLPLLNRNLKETLMPSTKHKHLQHLYVLDSLFYPVDSIQKPGSHQLRVAKRLAEPDPAGTLPLPVFGNDADVLITETRLFKLDVGIHDTDHDI